MRSPADLSLDQCEAVEFMYERDGAALFAFMGVGKTAAALTLLARLKREGQLGRALVAGPLRAVNTGWPDEIGKWRHTRRLTYSVVTGSAKKRIAALGQNTDVHLVNRENIPWLVEQFVDFTRKPPRLTHPWPYDVVIIDEATGVGDTGTVRFKALKVMRSRIKRFYELTATPAAEGYEKLFGMVYLLDRGERLGKSITRYRETYFTQNAYTHQWSLQPGAEDRITEKIADVVLIQRRERKPEDLPTFITWPVVLTPDQLDQYGRFERDYYMEVADGTEITAVHAGALATKMLQLSSGFIYDATGKAHHFHTAKIDALRELVEGAQGEPLIVVYWFKPSLALLQKAFPQAKTLDAKGDVQKAWNARKVPILLLHPLSAGEALNLQAGGSLMVFFDIPAPLEKYTQTIGRIDRQGQTRPVRIYHLIAQGTADEMAVERLARKESVQDGFFSRIKAWKEKNR